MSVETPALDVGSKNLVSQILACSAEFSSSVDSFLPFSTSMFPVVEPTCS